MLLVLCFFFSTFMFEWDLTSNEQLIKCFLATVMHCCLDFFCCSQKWVFARFWNENKQVIEPISFTSQFSLTQADLRHSDCAPGASRLHAVLLPLSGTPAPPGPHAARPLSGGLSGGLSEGLSRSLFGPVGRSGGSKP